MSIKLWLAPCLLTLSCGAQLGKDDGKSKVRTEDRATVGSEGATAMLAGASASVPPGAIAIGSTLAIEELEESPGDFPIGTTVQAAATPVRISATGPDGVELETLATPMSVKLSVPETAKLMLLPQATPENLCMLLRSNSGKLFVWRHPALTIEGAAATVQALFFGTFQLVYCGTEILPGFIDVAAAGMSSEPKATMALTIPADFRRDAHFCAVLLRHTSDSQEIIALADGPAVLGTATTVNLAAAPSTLTAAASFSVVLARKSATQTCDFKLGDNLANLSTFEAAEVLAFEVDPAAIVGGSASGTVGQAGTAFALQDVRVAIGVPEGATAVVAAAHAEGKACVIVSRGKVATTYLEVAIEADGKINGASTLLVPLAGTQAEATAQVQIGSGCSPKVSTKAEAGTGRPYWLRVPEQSVTSTFWLSPVSLRLDNRGGYSGNACIEVFPSGGLGSGITLGKQLVALAGGTYGVYLPYVANEAYDMRVTLVATDDCDEITTGAVPAVPLKNKSLAAEILVDLPPPGEAPK